MDEIKDGDVVCLKSGGPSMTVEWINSGKAYCVWFHGTEMKNGTFATTAIKKDDRPKGPVRIV